MGSGEYVRLKCEPQTLEALASGLTHYAPADGEPDWLVTGVWLCAKGGQYLATASVEVLPDGFVARSLNICTPDSLAERLRAELPDVATRLAARGNGMTLPLVETPSPQLLKPWRSPAYATTVLVRVSRRGPIANRVACGLLFADQHGGSLLIGSDPSTLALVLSEDPGLISRYRKECEELTPADYLTGA